jgi:hypothetical protein
MKLSLLIIIAVVIAMFIAGCPPPEREYYAENFTGMVVLLNGADSLLTTVTVEHKAIDYYGDLAYTYITNCDSTGAFDIYVGPHSHGEIIYLEFSCPGYASQHYPVTDENGQIGTITLIPDPNMQ